MTKNDWSLKSYGLSGAAMEMERLEAEGWEPFLGMPDHVSQTLHILCKRPRVVNAEQPTLPTDRAAEQP